MERQGYTIMLLPPATTACPTCRNAVYEYRDGRWTERICWRCGHYEADTPAFMAQPDLYRDIVRKNGRYFMQKYARYAATTTSVAARGSLQ